MTNIRFRVHAGRGFTLIEALVALLVLAFGMFAIAGLQLNLGRNSDLAKQRSEATRLAQEKVDDLRTFQQKVAQSGVVSYQGHIVAGSEVLTGASTNTSYTRTVTVSSGASDFFRWVGVNVAWTDRTGGAQSVQLRTVISNSEPADIGTLATGPGNSGVLKPKGRNINIPYPAVTLSGGATSAFIPPPGNVAFIFNNTTGNVIGRCTPVTSLVEGQVLDPGTTANCEAFSGYLLSGYVRFASGMPSGNEDARDRALTNTTTATLALAPTVAASGADPGSSPLSFTTPTGAGPAPASTVCYSQRQKVLRSSNNESMRSRAISGISRSSSGVVTVTTSVSHGFSTGLEVAITGVSDVSFLGVFRVDTVVDANTFTYRQYGGSTTLSGLTGAKVVVQEEITIPEADTPPSGWGYTPESTTLKSRFVAYTCVVTPQTSGGAWSAKVTLNPSSTWSIASSGNGTYRICRFTADYNRNGVISNAEHPLVYRGVGPSTTNLSGALDNQNYLVMPNGAGNACPADLAANPSATDFINTNTAFHQPATSEERSFQCSSVNSQDACSTKGVEEPDSGTSIPME